MRIFFTVFAFLTLVHFFASIVEVDSSVMGRAHYAEALASYCKGDICK